MDGNRGNLSLTASRQLYIHQPSQQGNATNGPVTAYPPPSVRGRPSGRRMATRQHQRLVRVEGPSPRGPDSKSSPCVSVPSGSHSATLMVLGLPVKEVALFPPAARGPHPGAQRA